LHRPGQRRLPRVAGHVGVGAEDRRRHGSSTTDLTHPHNFRRWRGLESTRGRGCPPTRRRSHHRRHLRRSKTFREPESRLSLVPLLLCIVFVPDPFPGDANPFVKSICLALSTGLVAVPSTWHGRMIGMPCFARFAGLADSAAISVCVRSIVRAAGVCVSPPIYIDRSTPSHSNRFRIGFSCPLACLWGRRAIHACISMDHPIDNRPVG
jgi:hypothetical protein